MSGLSVCGLPSICAEGRQKSERAQVETGMTSPKGRDCRFKSL
jgi:hypothetical protein